MSYDPDCTGRIAHATRRHAFAHIRRKRHARLTVYRCRNCRRWHVGWTPRCFRQIHRTRTKGNRR